MHRGAQGFVQFASADEALSGHMPIYIYDRLDEPTRAMLEENLAYAEGGDICVTFASGMAADQRGAGRGARARGRRCWRTRSFTAAPTA